MHFSTIVIPFATLVTSALAAECFSQGGSRTCMSLDGMRGALNQYCENSSLMPRHVFKDGGNGFQGTISGNWKDQSTCFTALNDIVNQCAGHKNGGSYNVPGTSLTFDFCS